MHNLEKLSRSHLIIFVRLAVVEMHIGVEYEDFMVTHTGMTGTQTKEK